MAEEREKDNDSQKEKGGGFIRTVFLHPHEALMLLGKDRYRSLQLRMFLLIGTLAGVPLFLVMLVGFFWLRDIFIEDLTNQLRWQVENTRRELSNCLRERASTLRFLSSTFEYHELKNQKKLDILFSRMKSEHRGIVDLGVIDDKGIQQSYSGPFDLKGKDYSQQDWYQKVKIRGEYVSDIFTGYRNVPHFSIAVKHEITGTGTFWVMRVTIDIETLKSFISTIKLREYDDSFILNEEGVLQTPSRFYGKLLEKSSLPFIPPRQEFTLARISRQGEPTLIGYDAIKDSPWILVVSLRAATATKFIDILRREMVAVYLVIVLIIIGIMVNIRTVKTVSRWIEDADKKREEAISQTEHSAKLASVGRLAAGVAHEINNPLAIINEKAGLMKDILEFSEELAPCRDRFMPLITAITDSINRCRTITHRLLGFARRMDVKIEQIDINDAIREVVGFLEREIVYHNIRLEFNLNETMPLIESDRGQIQQVILNIINNSIDAVPNGGLIIVSSVHDDPSFIRIMIRDNGHGIPRDKLKHIFEPFYTTKEKGKGTGLGLSLSYGIIQRLGGTVQVDSVVGKGTTFTLKLPLKVPDSGG